MPGRAEDGDRQGQDEVQSKDGRNEKNEIGAESIELTMREIHHLHDAEDEREPDPEKRVGAAQDQRVGDVLEEFGHGVLRLT